ncbi:MAG: hypothetical protein PVJ73_01545 [Acidobacteriota bacterium]
MSDDGTQPASGKTTSAHPGPPVPLRAGPLSLVFDRGELRWMRLGGREVLRGIYVAVRPPTWETVPAELENVRVDTDADGFRVRFDARHREGPLWFEWEGRIDGGADGTVRFEMDGVARSTFVRNRIGLCVLHPATECAGRDCTKEKSDGSVLEEAFPRLVSPHQTLFDVRALRHEVAPGIDAEVRFEGELFETEDQRNWSDASFKTYSTPLALPLPVEVRKDERIRQVVTLTLHGAGASAPAPRTAAVGWLSEEVVRVAVEPGTSWPMPRLGLGLEASPLPPRAIENLRAIAPAHLRVDVRPGEAGWRDDLATASDAARAGATRLELAALISAEKATDQLQALADAAESLRAPIDTWLVFDAATRVTTPDLTARAREFLLEGPDADRPPALLGGGTDAFFAELNRGRDAVAGLDLVSLALNPQVHAFDDATLVENTTTLGWIAETIHEFAGQTPLALSPVTLRPRPASDRRQATNFAAGWTLGLVAAAARAGFARLTLFKLRGPGGVADAARRFPVGHLLADLTELTGSGPEARVIAARPDDGWRCLALALRVDRHLRVFVFNTTDRPQEVVVTGLPHEALRRRLGVAGTEGFDRGEPVIAAGDGHALRLGPHEVAALDLDAASR